MTGSITAELLVVGKRASTWILLAVWTTLALVFAYVAPYVTYLNGSARNASWAISWLASPSSAA